MERKIILMGKIDNSKTPKAIWVTPEVNRDPALAATYITKIESMNTGGNFMVDLIHLENGRVIGVSMDCIVLYPSIEAFEENNSEEYPFIDLY